MGRTARGKANGFLAPERVPGGSLRAAWEDIKFGIRHGADVDRIAFVGGRRWDKWMAMCCRPFTHASVRYFDASEIEAARDWLRG
jgi:SpoIIAA-like